MHATVGTCPDGRLTVEVTLEGGRLSIQGSTKYQGGQMQDTIRGWMDEGAISYVKAWNADRLARVLWAWDAYHLNDMRAGCEHQRAAGWNTRPIDPAKPLRAYGRHFEGQLHDTSNMLAWVRPDEHPAGLLTRPCPVCGYRYGSEWRSEELPAVVVAMVADGFESDPASLELPAPAGFSLALELGNAAMQEAADVAGALRIVADELEAGHDAGAVRDPNGNTVGRWSLEIPPAVRLEYLRGQLEAESISWGELAELQSLAAFIDPSDVQLLEAAGVPEGGQES